VAEKVICYLFTNGKYLRKTTGILKSGNVLNLKNKSLVFFKGSDWVFTNIKGQKISFIDIDHYVQLPLNLKLNEDIARIVQKAENWAEGFNDARDTFYKEEESFLKKFLLQYAPLIIEMVTVLAALLFIGNIKAVCVIK